MSQTIILNLLKDSILRDSTYYLRCELLDNKGILINRIYSLRICMQITKKIISFFDNLADNINLVFKNCVGWITLIAAVISSRA